MLKLLNFSCSRCSIPSDHSDHFLVNINSALRPKPKGRHKGTSSPPKKTTREQELERRVRKLEAENAYLKKSIALKAEKRSRTAIRRSS